MSVVRIRIPTSLSDKVKGTWAFVLAAAAAPIGYLVTTGPCSSGACAVCPASSGACIVLLPAIIMAALVVKMVRGIKRTAVGVIKKE
jgi:hypothetical protein